MNDSPPVQPRTPAPPTPSQPRRWGRGLGIALTVALVFAWFLVVPVRRERLYDVMPADALVVCLHEAPADRLDAWLDNPIVRGALLVSGVDVPRFQADLSNPAVRRWVRRIGSGDVIAGYVPRWQGAEHGAWVGAAWVGAYSQVFRWMLTWGLVDGVRPAGELHGQRLWSVDGAREALGAPLTFAVVEGMVLGCVSPDERGVAWLVAASDGSGVFATAAEQGWPEHTRRTWKGQAPPDRGWVNWDAPSDAAGIEAAFGWEIAASGIVVRLFGNAPAPTSDGGIGDIDREGLALLLGDAPGLLGWVPGSYLATGLAPTLGQETWSRYAGALGGVPGAVVALLGGEYSARLRTPFGAGLSRWIRGVRLPTLLLAVPAPDAQRALQGGANLLDALNADAGLGLIPRVVTVGDRTMTVIEGTGDDLYGRLDIDERAAYAAADGWFLLASNSEALRKLLARRDRAEARAQAASGRWLPAMREAENASVLWLDGEQAGKAFREAIGWATLALAVDGSKSAARTREVLSAVSRGIAVLELCSQVSAKVRTGDGRIEARLEAAAR